MDMVVVAIMIFMRFGSEANVKGDSDRSGVGDDLDKSGDSRSGSGSGSGIVVVVMMVEIAIV